MKKIVLTNYQVDKIVSLDKLKFYQDYNLRYKIINQSKVIFLIDTFYIDEFGNNSNPEAIEFSGEIGKKRLGDMLPMSYSKQLDN